MDNLPFFWNPSLSVCVLTEYFSIKSEPGNVLQLKDFAQTVWPRKPIEKHKFTNKKVK